MKKIKSLSLLILIVCCVFTACKNPGNHDSETVSSDDKKKKVVQYYPVIIDTLPSASFKYYAQFDTFSSVFPISPGIPFNLKYFKGGNDDSLTVRIFATDKNNLEYFLIWYKEPLDWSHRSCKNDTLYKTEILMNPDPAKPSITGPTTSVPVPIGRSSGSGTGVPQ
ncbi:MAG: hypothetical protein U0T77_11500 [Chitinophagales bacterium]